MSHSSVFTEDLSIKFVASEGGWTSARIVEVKTGLVVSTLSLSHEAAGISATVPFADFNARFHDLEFHDDSCSKLSFAEALCRYRLDETKISQHPYMTEYVFGAGRSRLQGSDMLYQMRCYMENVPLDWEFYGGMITMAVFRISDDLAGRKALVGFLTESYLRYAPHANVLPGHGVRWFISSSVNLAILLLYCEMEVEAERVVEAFLAKPVEHGPFPLTYMNMATMLFLRSALAFNRGERRVAYLLALQCADYCQSSVPKLFTARNRYYFEHRYDVELLTKLGYEASQAANSLGEGSWPPDSIIEYKRKKYGFKAKFDQVFHRFVPQTKSLPPMIYRINNRLTALESEVR